MRKIIRTIRRIAVTAIGFPLLIAGIILIPLPGPGLVLCIAAFFLLSLEFAWAKTYLDKMKLTFNKIIDKATERAEKFADRLVGEEKTK